MIQNQKHNKKYLIRIFSVSFITLVVLYLLLLIPEQSLPVPKRIQNEQFLWNQDSLWFALEKRFIEAKQTGCEKLTNRINESLSSTYTLLEAIHSDSLPHDAIQFSILENKMFGLAPLIGACQQRLTDYIHLFSRLRFVIKNQSIHWDMNSANVRQIIYRLLYGGRAALEEVMLQAIPETIPAFVMGHEEPSETPSAKILGLSIHSGDILVSRGGAPTSALIARGNDYPGNFSHVALVHVDEKTYKTSIIEAHIEKGVAIANINEYLRDKKLRVMVLRLRADIPQIIADPLLPHKAASLALDEVMTRHIPYDFEMNHEEHSELFCSEVASAPYQKLGVKLWMGISHISSPGIVRWLSLFGVRYFETQEPSDLEYDPQLRVIAEWRDPETLFKDHIDNAVIEVMLESSEKGRDLNYSLYQLPLARIAKLYSYLLNTFGLVGPVPEGMSATAGLRNNRLSEDHQAIKKEVELMAIEFKKQNDYTAPYWKLVDFSRKAMLEINY